MRSANEDLIKQGGQKKVGVFATTNDMSSDKNKKKPLK